MTRKLFHLGKREMNYTVSASSLHETCQANKRDPAMKITFRFEITLYSFPIKIHLYHGKDKLIQGSLRSSANHSCQHGQVVIVLRS